MEVILTKSRVGDGFSQRKGDLIEVDDGEGQRLIEAGMAIPASEGTPKRRGRSVPRAQKAAETPEAETGGSQEALPESQASNESRDEVSGDASGEATSEGSPEAPADLDKPKKGRGAKAAETDEFGDAKK